MEAFIDDGYTEQGYIAAVERLHPAVSFTFRPMQIEQRAKLIDAVSKAAKSQPGNDELVLVKALEKHLVSWSLGREINAENIRKLRFQMFYRLSQIVLYGSTGSDVDPSAKETKTPISEYDLTPDERAEADAKN